jgi:predicted nucleotidyltransferase
MKNASTPFPYVNDVLAPLAEGIGAIFGDNLIGLYLTGSLSYGDFDPKRSDIDLFAVVKSQATGDQLERLKSLHQQTEIDYPHWATRIESQYVPIHLFSTVLPPTEARPYYGDGVFYDDADYGNEWIINNYLLVEHAITLIGLPFSTLIDPIDFREVQKACIRDVFREWEPKIRETAYLENGHYQSYLVLNLCRILYTVLHGETGSKRVSAAWVKANFPQWTELIEAAEMWGYGDAMGMQDETVEFIKFVVEQVRATDLYGEIEID